MLQRSMLHVSVSTHYHHHHHYTVQVAMPAHMCLCTSLNGLVGIEKHYQCQLQVMITMSASEVFALVDDREKHQKC